ncbi:MAG: site-specific integrase [Anaerolineales bacterium]|jgi:integrase
MAKRRANNEGTIYKRDNGKWRAQITLNGYRLSYTGDTQKACQDWIKETRNQIDKGLTFRGANTKLEDFLAGWLITVNSSRSENTAKLYKWMIENRIIPYIGHLRLKDLSTKRIQNYYDFLCKKGLSEHAVSFTHKVLQVAMGHAVKLSLIVSNPCVGTTPPKSRQTEMKFLDENQVQVLLTTAQLMDDRFYPLYHLAIHTGMRQAELLGLKWKDLDGEHMTIQVKRQVLHHQGGGYSFTKPKSKSGIRTIILGKQAVEILKNHRELLWNIQTRKGADWIDLDLIFPSQIGSPVTPSNLRRAFRRLLKASGLPHIRFHDLRHTAASLMLNHGIPVLIASKRLGHSKPSITMDVYGHLIPSKQEEAANLMDELMTPIDISGCTQIAPD